MLDARFGHLPLDCMNQPFEITFVNFDPNQRQTSKTRDQAHIHTVNKPWNCFSIVSLRNKNTIGASCPGKGFLESGRFLYLYGSDSDLIQGARTLLTTRKTKESHLVGLVGHSAPFSACSGVILNLNATRCYKSPFVTENLQE